MPRDKALDSKMDKIAHFVADKLLASESVDKELNDAFKTLTQYWTSATKLDKGEPGEDEGFGGIRKRIAEAGNGEKTALTTINGGKTEVEHKP